MFRSVPLFLTPQPPSLTIDGRVSWWMFEMVRGRVMSRSFVDQISNVIGTPA